jgi:CRP/FNR family transcriptional regulator
LDLTREIAGIPLFEGLPQDQLKELAEIIIQKDFKRGQMIFSEGDEGTGFYVAISGRVKIFKLSLEGKEQILHIFGSGEPFGEVPVFTGRHFPAHAQAMDESRVFFFPREAFVDLIRENPSIALNMLAVLSMRLRRFTVLIDDLSLKEVPGRLAAYLLYVSEQNQDASELELAITKGQLASLLGTIPETLSRIFGRMAKQGLIASEGHRIKILNRAGLKGLAEEGERL